MASKRSPSGSPRASQSPSKKAPETHPEFYLIVGIQRGTAFPVFEELEELLRDSTAVTARKFLTAVTAWPYFKSCVEKESSIISSRDAASRIYGLPEWPWPNARKGEVDDIIAIKGTSGQREVCLNVVRNLPLSGLTWDVTDDLPKAGGEGPSTSGQSGAGGGAPHASGATTSAGVLFKFRPWQPKLDGSDVSKKDAKQPHRMAPDEPVLAAPAKPEERRSDSRREANAAADSVKHAAGGVVQQSGRKRKASSDEGDKKRRDGGQAARAIDEPLQDRAAAAEVSQRQDKGPDAGQHGRRSHEQAEVESAQLASVSGQKVVASDEDAKGTGQETPDEHVQAADEKKEALKPDARHEPEEAADTLEHAAGDVLQQPAGEKGSDEKRREEVDESGQERATGASASATGVDQAQHAMEACRRTLVAVRDEAGTALSDAGPSQAAPVRAFAARVGVLFVSLADISSLALASSIEASDVQEGLLELAAKLEKGGASSTGGGGSVEDREQEPHGSK
ncbi:tol-Pal system protein TolA-like [Paramacrobiotus metropolitanus]|uniref:tol-Pal system protein TolA-like n=1 Tax=Paramacrobiotus metropolitanus TaxID=2943436 RepID=UPI002445DBC8|nr:tol-Pal system protein TolA-like [Paramacrobiotus metropolitanus]